MEIKENQFKRYEEVRQCGAFNMYDPRAMWLSHLSKEKYLYIMKHYDELDKKFPNVRKGKYKSGHAETVVVYDE
jgi:hypothetical protein